MVLSIMNEPEKYRQSLDELDLEMYAKYLEEEPVCHGVSRIRSGLCFVLTMPIFGIMFHAGGCAPTLPAALYPRNLSLLAV